MRIFKKCWPVLLIYFVFLLLYYPVLSVYFSGDDFFHFKVALRESGAIGLIKLFGFYSFSERGIAFYRPLFRDGLYNLFSNAFGLSHYPFRVLQFVIHFANITLVYIFFEKFISRRLHAIFIAFFYAITAAQVGSLYYLAGGIQAQGATMFLMLSLISYWKYLGDKGNIGSRRWGYLAFVSFLFGLMSHELAIVIPLLLFGLWWVKDGIREIRVFGVVRRFWIYCLVAALYLYLNYFVIGFSDSEVQYSPVIMASVVANTYMWYTGWAVGLPEMLVDFVMPGFKLNPNLMNHWGSYFRIIFPAFIVSVITLVIFGIAWVAWEFGRLRKGTRRKLMHAGGQGRKFWFLVFWFLIALLPVIFLPLHKKTYYLATALPAFWGLAGYIAFGGYDAIFSRNSVLAKILLSILVASLTVLSVSSIRLSDITYWAAKRGRLAEKLINDATKQYPELPKGSILLFLNDPDYPEIAGDWGGSSTQANYILNGSDALQLVYDDSELVVIYEDIDGANIESVYTIIAEID